MKNLINKIKSWLGIREGYLAYDKKREDWILPL